MSGRQGAFFAVAGEDDQTQRQAAPFPVRAARQNGRLRAGGRRHPPLRNHPDGNPGHDRDPNHDRPTLLLVPPPPAGAALLAEQLPPGTLARDRGARLRLFRARRSEIPVQKSDRRPYPGSRRGSDARRRGALRGRAGRDHTLAGRRGVRVPSRRQLLLPDGPQHRLLARRADRRTGRTVGRKDLFPAGAAAGQPLGLPLRHCRREAHPGAGVRRAGGRNPDRLRPGFRHSETLHRPPARGSNRGPNTTFRWWPTPPGRANCGPCSRNG